MLVVLVGPKGSGKSHIGRVLERACGVRFLHIEPLWIEYHAECERAGRAPDISAGITRIHPRVAEALSGARHVCVETTGASREILDGLLALAPGSERIVVRVIAPLELCLERIARRDPAQQIPVSPDDLRRIFHMSLAVRVEADLTLENADLSDSDIAECFRALVGARKAARGA